MGRWPEAGRDMLSGRGGCLGGRAEQLWERAREAEERECEWERESAWEEREEGGGGGGEGARARGLGMTKVVGLWGARGVR